MCVWGLQLLQKMEQQMGREQLMNLFRHLTTVVLNKRHTINTEMDDLKEVLSLTPPALLQIHDQQAQLPISNHRFQRHICHVKS